MIRFKNQFLPWTAMVFLVFSCQQNSKKGPGTVDQDSILSMPLDTIKVDTLSTILAESPFDQMLEHSEDSLFAWGFTEKEEKILKEKPQFDRHWWLKIFRRPISPERVKRLKLRTIPKRSDLDLIDSIRQVNYKKGWKLIIEEWSLKDEKAAQRWFEIAVATKKLDDFKPPRVYWRERDNIYFIMGSAAKDWSDHGNQLVEITSGKTRWLIELLNDPIDLPRYKKEKRNANSGTSSGKSYFHKPDTTGTYYHYFGFHELRRQYGEQKAWHAVEIETYKYGTEIGDYSDSNEEFISLKAQVPDRHLGRLNLVGADRSQIINQFGPGDQRRADFISNLHNGYWLLLRFENEKVNWFKVTKVREGFDLSLLPEEAFEF